MAKRLGYVTKTQIRKKGSSKGSALRTGNLPALLWLAYPVLFVLLFQSMAAGSLIQGFAFLLFKPFPFLMTSLLTGFLGFVLWWLIGNKWISFTLLQILGAVIALGSRITLAAVDSGLALNNLAIFNELQLISNTAPGVYVPYILILVPAMAGLYFLVWNLRDFDLPVKNRKLTGLLLALAFLLFSQGILPGITMGNDKLAKVADLGILLYFNNGFSSKDRLDYPTDKEVAAVMKDVAIASPVTGVKPNVILVELGNFVDLSRLKAQGTDPLPNYHNLYNDATRYILDLSTRKGDNLNQEFEALTGLPADFYPNDAQVRGSNVGKGTISLGSIFSTLGYKSCSVLPYKETLNQRQLFYNNLGFDSFLSLEDLGEGRPEDVLGGIEESLKDGGGKPVFVYSQLNVLADRYAESPETAYAADLKVLDGYLLKLKEIVGATKVPTIVVLYSGGMPELGDGNKLLYDYDVLRPTDLEVEKAAALNEGDLLLWNNYNQAPAYPAGDKADLSSLPEMILGYGNFKMPNYLYYDRYLKKVRRMGAISGSYMELDGILYAKDSDTYKKLAKDFLVIVKDVLGPNKYVEEDKDKWTNQ